MSVLTVISNIICFPLTIISFIFSILYIPLQLIISIVALLGTIITILALFLWNILANILQILSILISMLSSIVPHILSTVWVIIYGIGFGIGYVLSFIVSILNSLTSAIAQCFLSSKQQQLGIMSSNPTTTLKSLQTNSLLSSPQILALPTPQSLSQSTLYQISKQNITYFDNYYQSFIKQENQQGNGFAYVKFIVILLTGAVACIFIKLLSQWIQKRKRKQIKRPGIQTKWQFYMPSQNKKLKMQPKVIQPQRKPSQEDLMKRSRQSYSQYCDIKHLKKTYLSLICPISFQLIKQPGCIKCGHTFEMKNIKQALRRTNKCPLCQRQCSQSQIFTNYSMKQMLVQFRKLLKTKGQEWSFRELGIDSLKAQLQEQ